jgi:hypothetical protein
MLTLPLQSMLATIRNLVGWHRQQAPTADPQTPRGSGSAADVSSPDGSVPEVSGPEALTDASTYDAVVFRFLALPPLWVLALVILPATVAFAWWAYSGLNRLERPTRIDAQPSSRSGGRQRQYGA